MSAAAVAAPLPSTTRAQWTGRVLSALAVLFLLMDLGMKLAGAKPAVDATTQLGFQPEHVLLLGLIQLACMVLYLVPRTAPLGAVLWTGYLGGAIATHLRLGNPLVTHILFPVYVGAFLWVGLYLRDPRVRALLADRRR